MSDDPFSREKLAKIKRARRLSFFVVLWDELTLRLWRLVGWIAAFFTLSLLDIPARLGEMTPTYIFWLFLAGLVYWIYTDAKNFRWPSRDRVDRAIEAANALPHRPLNALNDALANPDELKTRNLWDKNKERVLKTLAQLKVSKRNNLAAKSDPYAVRLFALMILALSAFLAGDNAAARLSFALSPQPLITLPERTASVQLRIIPPAYTGYGQIVLSESDNAIKIPQGSEIKVIIGGSFLAGVPILKIGEREHDFKKDEARQYIAQTKETNEAFDSISVKGMLFTRAKWDVEYIADTAPKMALKAGIEVTAAGTMSFPLSVYDDYGVQDLELHIELRNYSDSSFEIDPISITRIVSSEPQIEFDFMPSFDVTRHIWAGNEAILTLSARDALGQIATLKPITMKLPERVFHSPVAQELINIRKELIKAPLSSPLPLINRVEDILIVPHRYYDDYTVFLALKSAAGRLFWANPPSLKNSLSTVDLLWDTALRIEDGGLSLITQALKDLQNKIQKALQNPAGKEQEIAEMMLEMRRMMSNYMQALAQEMRKRMRDGEMQSPMPDNIFSNIVGPDDLARLMEKMEQQLLAGDTKGAQETLAQIERLMNMMNPAMQAPMPKDMVAMAEMLKDLQPLIQAQKDLLKNTQRNLLLQKALDRLNQLNTDIKPIVNNAPLQIQQADLTKRLKDIITQASFAISNMPPSLQTALDHMQQASVALGSNDLNPAQEQQQKALDALQNSQQQTGEQLTQRMSQMIGINPYSSGRGSSAMIYDPLGRPYNPNDQSSGNIGENDVKVPNDAQRAQARALLNELRRRYGEYHRPRYEREYYRRLLKQF